MRGHTRTGDRVLLIREPPLDDADDRPSRTLATADNQEIRGLSDGSRKTEKIPPVLTTGSHVAPIVLRRAAPGMHRIRGLCPYCSGHSYISGPGMVIFCNKNACIVATRTDRICLTGRHYHPKLDQHIMET
jgi:hypothetical protein